ncbi:T9SS type A sorting domain-containing protein [Winogradskyella maritima]|uniref:T9SS type A sorting domain-containing protein n=1 Tax=Winogradskyella maritima TaxID=1517766 RepID=A0ABV8AGN7_9FLAO|nr:T9SS type A sorting domain-containing protein [Winogradskyella maritima]
MKYLSIAFISISFLLPAQEFFSPESQLSFGSNNHTNRDISYFSIADEFDNIIAVGTTEKDSSFTDIVLSKFDNDLNLQWQRSFSEDTDLSYDIPLSLQTDLNNNIYISFRSSHNVSNTNGDAVIKKYSSDGDMLWTINITSELEYDVFDYKYFNVYVSENGTLNAIYFPVSYESNSSPIHFITISVDGSIVDQYSIELNTQLFKENFINGKYVLFYTEPIDENFLEFNTFYRILDSSSDLVYQLNDQSEFPSNFNTSNFEHFNFLTNSNHESYLVWQEYNLPELNEIYYSKINANGIMAYNLSSGDSISSYYLSSFLNSGDELNILSNSSAESTSSLNLTLNVYDVDGYVLSSHVDSDTQAGSVKVEKDNSILAFTQENKIRLYDQSLSLLNESAILSANNINDVSKTSLNEIVTSETSLDKMYPDSDYFTQMDVVLNKFNSNSQVGSYSFGGIGTSKVNRINTLIDNEDKHYVLLEEKLGPDNTSIGGSRAPETRRIERLDESLNSIWSIPLDNEFIDGINEAVDSDNNLYINTLVFDPVTNQITYELIKISSFGEVIFQTTSENSYELHVDHNNNVVLFANEYNSSTNENDFKTYTYSSENGTLLSQKSFESQEAISSFNDTNDDFYIYTYTGQRELGDDQPTILSIYRNMDLHQSIVMNMAFGNEEIDLRTISEPNLSGTISFGSRSGQLHEKLHKVSLSGSYSSIPVSNIIETTKILDDGSVFVIIDDDNIDGGHIEIYNENLIYETGGPSAFYGSKIFLINDYIFLYRHFDSTFHVFNKDGVLVDKLVIEGDLFTGNLSSTNKFIISGTFGNQIYTFQQFSWTRGFLSHYLYNGPNDDDGDGIGNSIDQCQNTPNGEDVNNQGCSTSQIDSDSDGVVDNVDQCPFTETGLDVNEQGCALNQIDSDSDGVFDNVDLCQNSVLVDYVNEYGCFELPDNNFRVETLSETCPGENNGKIKIDAIHNLNYQAQVNNQVYNFTETLEIENLSPGTYTLKISINDENYDQHFNLNIESSESLTGRFATSSGLLTLVIDQGSKPYKVYKNNQLITTTNLNNLIIPHNPNDNIRVSSSKDCEGELIYCATCPEQLKGYPNPTSGLLFIDLDYSYNETKINIYDAKMRLLKNVSPQAIEGKAKIDLSTFSNGVYYIRFEKPNSLFIKVIKI